jgi:hypothetical protein
VCGWVVVVVMASSRLYGISALGFPRPRSHKTLPKEENAQDSLTILRVFAQKTPLPPSLSPAPSSAPPRPCRRAPALRQLSLSFVLRKSIAYRRRRHVLPWCRVPEHKLLGPLVFRVRCQGDRPSLCLLLLLLLLLLLRLLLLPPLSPPPRPPPPASGPSFGAGTRRPQTTRSRRGNYPGSVAAHGGWALTYTNAGESWSRLAEQDVRSAARRVSASGKGSGKGAEREWKDQE